MSTQDSDVTREGIRLIDSWLSAREQIKRAQSQLRSAETELANTASALAKWMLPSDAKSGEKIGVWHGDSLIQVTVRNDDHIDHQIDIRTRGRSLRA